MSINSPDNLVPFLSIFITNLIKMTIRDGAFPDNISAPVKELIESYIHLSNAHSTHTDHEKGIVANAIRTIAYKYT
jgi:hypothetical protein